MRRLPRWRLIIDTFLIVMLPYNIWIIWEYVT